MNQDRLNQRYREILSAQLDMNRKTWQKLRELGVTDSTELVLDFSYSAKTENGAKSFSKFLYNETNYEVQVESSGGENWTVSGSTQPTSVSLQVLDQWVDWMVTAGLHNDCEFEGWGTEVP